MNLWSQNYCLVVISHLILNTWKYSRNVSHCLKKQMVRLKQMISDPDGSTEDTSSRLHDTPNQALCRKLAGMCSDCAAGGCLQVMDKPAAKAIVGYAEDRGRFCLTMNGKHFFFIAVADLV